MRGNTFKCMFVRSFVHFTSCLSYLHRYWFKCFAILYLQECGFYLRIWYAVHFFLFIRSPFLSLSVYFSSHFDAIICIINIYILWYVHTIRKHLQYIRSHTYAFIVALKPLKPLKFKLKARTRCIHTWSMVKVAIFLFMVHMRAISSRYGKYMMSLLCRF